MKTLSVVTLICLTLNSSGCGSLQLYRDNLERDELIEACDIALTKCDKALKDKNKVIQAQKEQIKQSQDRVAELEGRGSDILSSKQLWFILGALFTGLVGFLVRK